ncbi:hypothetical protein [Streptomyces roseirectus]|uniref:hypothetical protein n=1 Tax=Streptomyces roseirectus TaxID=2768066 RepID=UPI001FEB1546|nr:hypothetical protein [Streptomyces roseirectus]
MLRALVGGGLEFLSDGPALGVLLLDLDVAFVDRVEHHGEVADADVGLVAGRVASTQVLLAREPGVELLLDRGLQGDLLAHLDPAAGLVVVRDRGFVPEALLQEVADLLAAPVVVLVRDLQQDPDLVEFLLGFGGGLEAALAVAAFRGQGGGSACGDQDVVVGAMEVEEFLRTGPGPGLWCVLRR